MENATAIQARNVSKRFGSFYAVKNVSFELRSKDAVGIIGPNGAGKTTFVNILTGRYVPEEGSIEVLGHDMTRMSTERRVGSGLLRTFQLVHVFDTLTVHENIALSIYRKKEGPRALPLMLFRNLYHRDMTLLVESTLELFGIASLRLERVESLSLGSKKKLELAMIYAVDPEIMILDEPFAGLGDQEIDEIVMILKQQVGRKTMIIVEHKLSKLTAIVDNLAVMHEGELIASGPCEETLNHPEVRRSYWKLGACDE